MTEPLRYQQNITYRDIIARCSSVGLDCSHTKQAGVLVPVASVQKTLALDKTHVTDGPHGHQDLDINDMTAYMKVAIEKTFGQPNITLQRDPKAN